MAAVLNLPENRNDDHDHEENQKQENFSSSKEEATQKKRPGGWKAMPYIIGNETFERLGVSGLLSNFNVFLLTKFHLDQVTASNIGNIWSSSTSLLHLAGAYIADAYVGRFKTIAFASFSVLLGMIIMTLIPWIPKLHPPPCPTQTSCTGPTKFQMGVLAMVLGFLSIGSAGIRPCTIPFGVDQFDSTTEEGRKGINSFFNWYFATFTWIHVVVVVVVIYVQTSISWVIGFGVPTFFMVFAIILFFMGTKLYVHKKPDGSIFSAFFQGLVAAYKKRKLELPENENGEADRFYYDPRLYQRTIMTKLSLTNQFRFLNKAAIVVEGDIQQDGSRANKWNLSSIQQIEEIKCLLRIVPVWAAGIVFATANQDTFLISQALKMNRHLGSSVQIPPVLISVISSITVGTWLPIYDRIIVPSLRKRTKILGGITFLQRIGIGLVLSVLSMIVAAIVEPARRASANSHDRPDGVAPMSVFWLAPQLILLGLADTFTIIGQIELYNKEFPDNMTSLANSLLSVTYAGANYLSVILVNVIHHTTGTREHPDWLTQDINKGRLEYFYFLNAGLGVLNLMYFLYVSPKYRYKSRIKMDDEV